MSKIKNSHEHAEVVRGMEAQVIRAEEARKAGDSEAEMTAHAEFNRLKADVDNYRTGQ